MELLAIVPTDDSTQSSFKRGIRSILTAPDSHTSNL